MKSVLIEFFKKHKNVFCIYIFLTIIFSITLIIIPQKMGVFIDELSIYKHFKYSLKFVEEVLPIILISHLLSYLKNYLQEMIKFELDTYLNEKLLIRYLDSNYEITKKLIKEELVKRLTTSIQYISKFIITFISVVFTNLFSICLIVFTIYRSNKELSLLLFLIAPIYALINYFFRNKLKNAVIKNKKSDEKYFSIYFKLINTIEYIKLNALKNKVLIDLDNEKKVFKQNKSKQIKYENIYIFVSSLTSNIFRIVYILLLGYFMINGEITIGMFTMIITFSSQLLRYMDSIMDLLRDWNVCLVHVRSLDEIIDNISDEGNMNKELKQMSDSINSLTVKNLSYKVDDNLIINDFSYNFQKSMIYIINGPNGSGKSTLFKIISGLLRDYEGVIKINSCDIKKIDMNYLLKKRISIDLQNELPLYDFGENVEICNILSIDKQKSIKIRTLFNLKDSLRVGLNINNVLSEGENKKLSLINALSKPSEILLLDEPTNFLDFSTVKSLIYYLKKIKKNKIIIIITHDRRINSISDFIIDYNNKR